MKNTTDMKSIEDIIRNNKDFFEDAEPSDGHMERFNRKLEMRFPVNTVKRSIVPYLLKAAVVTLLGPLYSYRQQQNNSRTSLSSV